jgi:alpha-tubulin suppressor-like RCC1 family protein
LNYWTQVACGYNHTAAILSPGTLWAWGSDAYGKLGNNSTTPQSSPVQIGALSIWTQVAAGYGHTAALQNNGTLWSWGLNSQGQLGLITTVGVSSPVQVGALSTWTRIACGYYNTAAIQTPGTLWTWGNNSYGQLGSSNTTNRSSPTQVGALSIWTNVSPGLTRDYAFTVAIQTPGTLWSWGQNFNGSIGDNTNAPRSSPVQIGSAIWANSLFGSGYQIYVAPSA